ncbi:bifunctional indole-3-glycerol-phosphate synthase TrpC/phosphoribosylanthranilate isomerase TrpF [Enterobacteriaceae endosymbiont of Plateumaris consimilis]|uniref:bifunctional indole-3-glycerol-phosphate synthase TrpC/phosphoribosylanthranilate isomerase TrpF n=1 Tax=Enterobacteriaceae endosymbiont of Plateumaris consimilis TaxID=2675794 RepID=UPI00144928E2|nr:bifunctional indole-3-glycerol-phosphate synthase TrpC/phosphoribosylanthranilate isomerase TrpF [Enterobacteriaceae endosymbiont of Plateumaris consimilis]QJC28512.1 bifunctional indole-3-glycerol-phosphate synthase TrpC/phosphoribosylanthranilate isomerase TrpF [Enterobacteriaceae endosymbiont of Plateumaris consimilis]
MYQKNILKEIIKNKISWIQNKKKFFPIKKFFPYIKKTKYDFYHALKSNNSVFILECKKYSPSKGLICKNYDLKFIAHIYKKYSSVISVLTDEKYFQGSFDDINIVRNIVSQPILCKDFILDSYQIYFARYHKADAILLILSILNDKEYIQFSTIANKLNMGILTEINNEKELKRAICLKAQVIGINNRNLENFTIDINKTYNLVNLNSIPKQIILISESGINSNCQIRQLSKFVHGFLIGSAITSKKNILFAVKNLIYGKNKICGLRKIEDAKVTNDSGSIFGGLIFVNNSIRNINLKTAKNIVFNIKPLLYIGIFYNNTIEEIVHISKILLLYAVQLHGEENQNFINILRSKLPNTIKIWKVIKINNNIPIYQYNNVDLYVYDNYLSGKGIKFNWKLLKNKNNQKILLAGGLNKNNFAEAIKLKCYGLDFNSGVESIPGIKDHLKIKEIFKKLSRY